MRGLVQKEGNRLSRQARRPEGREEEEGEEGRAVDGRADGLAGGGGSLSGTDAAFVRCAECESIGASCRRRPVQETE
jgi:hypothetical protein